MLDKQFIDELFLIWKKEDEEYERRQKIYKKRKETGGNIKVSTGGYGIYEIVVK